MNTIEDFKNAPLGATATHKVTGIRAMKTHDAERCWVFPRGNSTSDEQMAYWGYTLDLPTTAREALDMAWELAHEVKEGQVIPKGTRYLAFSSLGLMEHAALRDFEITPELLPVTRTVEPLPEPEPDWLDAPAVIAACNDVMDRVVFVRSGDNWWVSGNYSARTHSLRDVTPLYPKEGQEA